MADRDRDRRKRSESVSADRRTGRERRVHERVLASLEVDFECEDAYLFSYSADLSEMGIFIRTGAPYPPGTSLRLHFRKRSGAGGDGAAAIPGRVMWVTEPAPDDDRARPAGMGVQFSDLTAEQRALITDLVRSATRTPRK